MSKVALIVKTRTQPGKRDEVRRLFEKRLGPRALANTSQEVVVWCADDSDPDVFYLFEIYADRAAWQANSQAPWFSEYLQEAGPLLTGSSEFASAAPLWAKGLGL
jgi:quinol monooxygenase YgiN